MADSVRSARSNVTRVVSHHQRSLKRKPSSSITNARVKSVVHVSLKTPSHFVFPTAKNTSKSKSQKSADSSQRSISVSRVSICPETHLLKSSCHLSSRSIRSLSFDLSSKRQRTASNSLNARSTRSHVHSNTAQVNPINSDDHLQDSPPDSNQQRRKSQDFLDDLTNPSHRNKKQKYWWKKLCQCSELRICMYIMIILVIMIIIAVVLALVLIKQTGKSMKTPNGAYLRWNTTGMTLFGTSGIRGNTSTQFGSPFGIIFDADGLLYIADRNNHRIKRCDISRLTCSIIAGQTNGARGYNASDLSGPTYLYIDSNNYLYIADSENQRVQKWKIGATSGQTIAGVTNVSGSALNAFKLPYGMALDSSSSSMYIADYNNHRIMKYPSGASSGTVIAGGQGFGMNRSQLFRPAGLYLDSSTNSLIIANFGASNIIRWKLGDTQWTIVAGDSNGTFGNTSTLLDHPTNMIFDPMGNMYVADMFNHRIQFFADGQSNGKTIAGVSGVLGGNSTMLYYPVSMALDNQLNLYVTDSFNHRIQKFLRY